MLLKLFRAAFDQFVLILFTDLVRLQPFGAVDTQAVIVVNSLDSMIFIECIFITKPVVGNADGTDFFFHGICILKQHVVL